MTTKRAKRAKPVKARGRQSLGARLVALLAPAMRLAPEIRELPVVRKRGKAR